MRPKVIIELDRPRGMVLDLAAMIAFEQATGKKMQEIGEPSALELQALIWACLLDDDPDITQAQVGKLIHVGKIAECMEKFQELFDVSMPKGKAEKN